MNHYRLVHFTIDPFLGDRIAIAALVSSDGVLTVVPLPSPHGWTCLGGAAVSLMKRGLEELKGATSIDRLPVSMGPSFSLWDKREIPPSFGEPVAWVRKALGRAGGVAR